MDKDLVFLDTDEQFREVEASYTAMFNASLPPGTVMGPKERLDWYGGLVQRRREWHTRYFKDQGFPFLVVTEFHQSRVDDIEEWLLQQPMQGRVGVPSGTANSMFGDPEQRKVLGIHFDPPMSFAFETETDATLFKLTFG
jgi:hypothetical protein